MAATEFNTIDDFLNHSGSERGGGGGVKFLRSWKKAGYLDVWLHTKRPITAVWQHNFVRYHVKDNKEAGEVTRHFYPSNLVCWEDEALLRKQRFRNQDGSREHPPQSCPFCRLIESVRSMVDSGKLALSQPVFEFRGATDPKDDRVFHAGGICGLFNDRDLNDKQVAELNAKGIYLKDAWNQSTIAKLNYIFCIVNDEAPGDGVQIDTETQLLGDRVKAAIKKEMERKGDEKGNPILNPYCVRFKYDAKAKQIQDKYDAYVLEKPLRPEVEELIRGDAPDISGFLEPFNADTLRGVFEKYAVVDLPWDEIFSGTDAKPSGEPRRDSPRPPPPPSSKRAVQQAKAPEMIPCDRCKAPMREDQSKCGKCGAEYDIDGADDIPF